MLSYQWFQIPDMPFIDLADPLLSVSALGIIMAAALAVFVGALLGTRQLERQQERRKAAS